MQVLVYNFADLRLLHSIETLSNLGGLMAFSAQPEHTVLACPGLHAGQVRLLLGLSSWCYSVVLAATRDLVEGAMVAPVAHGHM